jgi:hypothetical protein
MFPKRCTGESDSALSEASLSPKKDDVVGANNKMDNDATLHTKFSVIVMFQVGLRLGLTGENDTQFALQESLKKRQDKDSAQQKTPQHFRR